VAYLANEPLRRLYMDKKFGRGTPEGLTSSAQERLQILTRHTAGDCVWHQGASMASNEHPRTSTEKCCASRLGCLTSRSEPRWASALTQPCMSTSHSCWETLFQG